MITLTFSLILIFLPSLTIGLSTYNVVSLGAKPDGKTDSTEVFVKAWNEACGSLGKSRIVVPEGRYLIQNAIKFDGRKCRSVAITFDVKGTLVAPSDFHALSSSATWLWFDSVNGVTLSGGKFDGKGVSLWNCKMSGKGGCPKGASVSNNSFF